MLMRTSFTNEPAKILIEKHGSEAWIWLRTNIEEVEIEDGKQFECDEAFFKTAATITEAEIDADFETYFAYASSYEEYNTPISLEKRVSDLEDALMAMMGV